MMWPFRRRAPDAERLAPQAAYALWAHDYPPQPHNRLMEMEQREVLALMPDVRGLAVLDAGCGSGRYLRELQARGARAVGIDLAPAMIARARAVTSRVARADLRALPVASGSIDLVICALALGDFAELDLALAETARVLRRGGVTIYSVVHPAGEAAGWTRTFESAGRRWAVDGVWHSLPRHRQACAAAGLAIEKWNEPELEDAPGRRALLVVRARR